MAHTSRLSSVWSKIDPSLELRARQLFWIGLVAIVVFGLIRTSARLGNSLNTDEPFSANLVHLAWPDMFAAFEHDNALPLYFLLLKPWTTIWGESEIGLRSLSLLCFAVTIIVIGLSVRQLSGWRAGMIAAFLYTASTPLALLYASTARPYALLSLEAAVGGWIYYEFLGRSRYPGIAATQKTGRNRARLYLALIVVDLAGLLTHVTFVFFMGAYIVAALIVSWKRAVQLAAGALASGLLFLLLWWPTLQKTLGLPGLNWLPSPTLSDLVRALANLWGAPGTAVLVVCVAVVMALDRKVAIQMLRNRDIWIAVTITATGIIMPFTVSLWWPLFHDLRTPMLILPMACVLIALILVRLKHPNITAAVLALVVLIVTAASIKLAVEPDPYQTRQSLQILLQEVKCGDMLVMSGITVSEVEYYLRQQQAPACVETVAFPASVSDHPGWMDIPGLLQDRAALLREVNAIADKALRHPNVTVWFFASSSVRYGHQISDVFQTEIENHMRLIRILDCSGSFFDSIAVYASRSGD
jgi:hypothetical protein